MKEITWVEWVKLTEDEKISVYGIPHLIEYDEEAKEARLIKVRVTNKPRFDQPITHHFPDLASG